MDFMTWLRQESLQDLITLGSVIAAILAWVAKLRWSKEYSDAKNAVIESKEASISEKEEQVKTKQSQIEFLEKQIEFFKEQTPQKLREHYKNIQDQLEEVIEVQKQDLIKVKVQLEEQGTRMEKSSEIQRQLADDIKNKEIRIGQLTSELSIVKLLQASAQRLEPSTSAEINKRIEFRLSLDTSIDAEEQDYYSPYPEELNPTSMAEWFLENYKDPANGVPVDEGEYVYVYGGPYDALEELLEHFPDVDEEIINAAVDKIENDGFEWVKRWQY